MPAESTGRSKRLLVLGGARSGKSAFAQAQADMNAERGGLARVFVATAQPFDEEMKQRIDAHRSERSERWSLVEAPYDLAPALKRLSHSTCIVLVDCLTVWLSNVTLRGDDVIEASDALGDAIATLDGPAVFVSNEVGAGIVPDNALARSFRDAQGRLNQRLARVCDSVVFVTAGLPLILKPSMPRVVDLL